jgi:hypothetical protein
MCRAHLPPGPIWRQDFLRKALARFGLRIETGPRRKTCRPNLKTRSRPMATICPFHNGAESKTAGSPTRSTDLETELTAIIAAAELAFDRVSRARQEIAA